MSAATDTPFAKTAHRYLAAGWSPLPLPAGAKANPPTGYTGANGRRPGPDDLEQWLEHGITVAGRMLVPAGNVAIRVPDTVVGVDVDQYGDKRGHDELLAELERLDTQLPETWISTARPQPAGIRYYRIPAGVRLRGAPLAGVEIVQAHHRYAVAPPSVHPNGDTYRWLAPGGELVNEPPTPDQLPDLPAELLDAWRDTSEPAKPRAAVPPAAAPAGRDRSRAVDEVLNSRRSWTPGGRHDEACRLSMALARLEHSGHPGATEALELVGADFTAAVAGERNGDDEWRSIVDSARAKAAGTEAIRPDYAELTRHSTSSTRSDGDNLAGLDVDADLTVDEHQADDLEADAWPTLEPLERTRIAPFPLDALPEWIANEARTVADELAVAVDLPAVAALGALSAVAGGRLDVQPGNRFRTPTNLYVCIVAESGAGKSPAMDRMVTRPCRALEQRLVELNRNAVAQSEARRDRLEAAVEKATKVMRNDPCEATERDVSRARAELAEHVDVVEPVVVLGDVTPEKLAMILADQQGRAAIVTPEGGSLFESIAGVRYRSSGAQTATVPEVYLSGYSREPIRADRVGRSATLVSNPTLTVVASVQPVVVERLAATPDVARQGALARFLWTWPADWLGYRPTGRYRHAPADDGVYRDRLVELGLRARSWTTPLVLDVDSEAADLAETFEGELEARMQPGGDLRPHRAAGAKLQTAPWRVAGLLAFADDGAADRLVDGELMRRAVALCRYFLDAAVAVERRAGVTPDGSNITQQVAQRCADRAGEQLEVRDDLYLPMRPQLPGGSITELVEPLLELEARGWVRIVGDVQNIGHQRLPNPKIAVHPQLSRSALHPVIETHADPITRETRELEPAAAITRETRDLEQPAEPVNARNGRSRVEAFRDSSSSVDSPRDAETGKGHARPRVTRVNEPPADPLFTAPQTSTPTLELDRELGDDPFGPANANDANSLELW